MSKIIKIIANSVTGHNNNAILFHENTDGEIIQHLDFNFYSLQKHNFNKIKEIKNEDLISPFFIPDIIICTSLAQYPNAKNLAISLYLPLVNIIKNKLTIKKEIAFDLSKGMDQDINLILNPSIINDLYISNFTLVSNLESLQENIKSKLKLWKPQ